MRQKEFFQAAIFAFCLLFIAGIAHSIQYILMELEVFLYDEFLFWFIVVNFLNISATVFLLTYLHLRSFTFSFRSGLVATFASTLLSLNFYFVVIERKLQTLYLPLLIFSLIAGTIYGVSLIISPAGKKPFLKATGILLITLSVTITTILLLGTFRPEYPGMRALGLVERWIGFIGNFSTLLFLLNFYQELKASKISDAEIDFFRPLRGWLSLLGMLSVVLILLSGFMMINETASRLRWQKLNKEQAQALVRKYGPMHYVNSQGDTLDYLLIKPDSIEPGKKYPLVVCLPAGDYQAPVAELLTEPANKARYPAFIFVPYCKERQGWGGNPVFPARDEIVYETINALTEPIDRKRQYVSGVSLGGFGAWHFITRHPEMFAAAIPVCGGGDPQQAGKFTDVAVWALHGAKDKNVPVERSREMIEAIKKAGGDPHYTEFPNLGHGVWYEVTITPGLLEWLFHQQKE
jgi:hypothetical protein